MSDIIEQINATVAEWENQDIACGPPCDMLRECAIEIERLRAGIQAYLDDGYGFAPYDPVKYFQSLLDGKNEG